MRLAATSALLALTCSVALALAPASASAHAAFLRSTPGPGTRLPASPKSLDLTFTEALDGTLATATITLVRGHRRTPAKLQVVGRRLLVTPSAALATGAYVVRWHSVSDEDGHALEGTFSFGVRAPASGQITVEQSPLARSGWLRISARALMDALLLLFAGATFLRVLLKPRSSWLTPDTLARAAPRLPVAAVAERARRVVGDVGVLAAAAAILTALLDAAEAAGGLSPTGVAAYLLDSTPGRARLGAPLLIALAAAAGARRPRLSAGLAFGALGTLAVSGHASAASPRLAAIVVDWTHLAGAAVWLGGISLIVLAWGPAVRRASVAERVAVARDVLPVFGRVALPAFLFVVMAGATSAVIEVGSLHALTGTGYGQVLLIKMLLVAGIAGISAIHVYRVRPQLHAPAPTLGAVDRRHWRLLRSEPLLGIGVIVAVALLVTFPLPPRELAEARQAQVKVANCDPCPLPMPRADELPVAENAGSRTVAAWVRRTRAGISGFVRLLDRRGHPYPGPLTLLGAGRRSCGPGCVRFTRPGRTPLRVIVPENGRRYTATLPIDWQPGRSAAARRWLERAETVMRNLHSAREVERESSGPGSFARVDYVLKAPDRVFYRTDGGTKTVLIGRSGWLHPADQPAWIRQEQAPAPFRTRTWFRWTPYAEAVRLLHVDRRRGHRVAEIALMDPGTPVWQRLHIDLRTWRVTFERQITPGHYGTQRFYAFNTHVDVHPPPKVRPIDVP